jgi:uncharacterized damage-inducible protein DinB
MNTRNLSRGTALTLAIATLSGRAAAQPGPGGFDQRPAAAPSTFKVEFLRQLDDVEKKLVSLAEAVPAEKYGWRPGEGVRSVGEVYMHIVGGNAFVLGFAGFKPAAPPDMKITEKAKIVAALKESFAFVRKSAQSAGDGDYETPVKMMGRDTSTRDVFFACALHLHEHLGQSIAYARSVGIVPPWTEERQKAAKAAVKPAS